MGIEAKGKRDNAVSAARLPELHRVQLFPNIRPSRQKVIHAIGSEKALAAPGSALASAAIASSMVSGGGGGCLAGFVMKDVTRSTSGFTGSCSPRLIGPSGPNPSRGFGGGRKRLEIAPNPSSLDRELSTGGSASCVLPLE